MINLLFNSAGVYLERPTIGGVEFAYEVPVDVLPDQEDRLDCFQYIDGEVHFNPDLQYARNRVSAYPDMATQLDMMYWDNKNGTTNWLDLVESIKARYPKENV